MNCEMAFLIVFPSFTPKKDAFFIGFKSFLILFSYSFYLFCSFLMHDGCSFFRTIAGLAIIPFLMSFINQLPIVYCFPVYHSPYILLFSLTHCHFFLLLSVSLHSSEQIVPLEWTVLFTLVHKPVHWSGTIQIQVGNRENALYSFLNLLYIYLTPILSFHLINKIFIFHLQYYLSTFT